VIDLRDKVAFITGGAQGIGLGMARALKSEAARLALVDIDRHALDAAAKELDAATYVLDVRDRDAYAAVVDDVEANVGPIAILCNNAGVGGGASVTAMTYEMWDWVLGVNNGGVVNGIQTVVPRMVERGEGHIVNTASGAGLVSTDGTGFMYNMSKYAVVGLSECIRYDLEKRGIGVSVLCPGPVATDIFEHTELGRPDKRELSAEQRARFERTNQWLKEKGTSPDAVGHMVVDGIKSNALYIHTDRVLEHAVLKRAQRIVAAMPPAVD
jgi:NAD(P)-dependent dehydrogenase (short-subunit alcohol dehydrogenase family)